MKRRVTRANMLLVLVCLLDVAFPGSIGAQSGPPAARPASPNELDAFMARVLEKRDINRQILEQYVLDEVEQVELLGPSRMPVFRQKREYTWYVRDGLHVRSPVRFDGVAVGDGARKEYEASWAKRERARLARKAEQDKKKEKDETPGSGDPPDLPQDAAGPGPSGSSPLPTPRFVSEAYFMDFRFEPGNYYLVGREQIEGQTVLRIEYYPTKMFKDDEEREQDRERQRQPRRDNQREREVEQRIERQMNKTALVTLWVDPAEHQIVKYTFDNVWMDFLPGGWLVKVDDIKASMTMGQPFPGVWLPREMNIHAGVTFASGPLEATYSRRFSDYKQADVATKIRIPKLEARSSRCCAPDEEVPSGPFVDDTGDPPAAPSGADARDPQEVIAEIRVHGNAYLKDAEVIRLAGIAVGQTLDPNGAADIARRLEASGYFETVEVRRRYRSLDAAGDVAIVLLVHERPGQRSEVAAERPSPWPWSRVKSRLMFLPILGYDDGYGFTYGGRVSTVDLLGIGERLSLPLTWGGTRRAAIEFERTFRRGPVTRIESTYGISQRENPRFEIDDRRVEWTARAERSFARVFRAGLDTSQGTVAFAPFDDRTWTLGADAALDTRGDPAFPRNAVYLGVGWNALHVRRLADPINRWTTDARGYAGVIRQAVLAGRALYSTADRTLPPYERYLLGGASTLRGFGAGAFAGDRLLAASAELRVPLTSVLNGAKLGVSAFMDAGKVWDVDDRPEDADWHRGVGGGVFLIATIVRLNLDVARGLKDGDRRVHFSAGFNF